MPAGPVSRTWRRFLRFSVRGLVVIVLVIGAGLGWIVRQAHVQRDAVAAIKSVGGRASYDINPRNELFAWKRVLALRRMIGDYIGIDFVFHVSYVDIHVTPENDDAAAHQAIDRLGDLTELEHLNLSGKSVTDGDLARLAGMKHLKSLMLQNAGISDAGLTHLRALTSLQEIYITNTRIGDDGLNHLRRLTNLEHLTYGGTKLTDLGMERLKELRSLKTLRLDSAHVSDAGLLHLKGLSNLSRLDLRGTRVTGAEIPKLKQALPNLKFIR